MGDSQGRESRDSQWPDTQGGLRERDPARQARSGGSAPAARARRSMSRHPIALIVAAVIGVAVLTIAVQAYLEWRARVALEEVLRAGAEATRKLQLQFEQQRRDAVAAEQARQLQLERQEASHAQAIRAQQQAQEDARQAILAEADRKERAWLKFYRRPASCNDAASMECANGYIRAKRAFEDKFARGEL
jgi:hypothetical protein